MGALWQKFQRAKWIQVLKPVSDCHTMQRSALFKTVHKIHSCSWCGTLWQTCICRC